MGMKDSHSVQYSYLCRALWSLQSRDFLFFYLKIHWVIECESQSQAASPTQGLTSQEPNSSTQTPMEFLLRSAATDFHVHQPSVVERFRRVRFGHVKTPDGAKQYQLCGEFLPQEREGKAEWTAFATIKTSGFEQYLGGQAANWCQRSRFVQDRDEDLSSTLQDRLDSMRLAEKTPQ